MAASLLLTLPAALKTVFTTALTGQTVTVYDGVPVTLDFGDLLFVNVADAADDNDTSAGTSQQTWVGLGKNTREETGEIPCILAVTNGESDIPAARARVKVLADLLANALRGDPNLAGAVPGLQWCGFGGRISLEEFQATDGAGIFLAFEVSFVGRP